MSTKEIFTEVEEIRHLKNQVQSKMKYDVFWDLD